MRKYLVYLFLIAVLLIAEYGNAAADCTNYTSGNTSLWLQSGYWGGNRVNNFPVGLIDYQAWCLYKAGRAVSGTLTVRVRRVSDNGIIGTFGSMNVNSCTVNAAWYYFTSDVINPVVQDVRFTCERSAGNADLYMYSKHVTVSQVQTFSSNGGSTWSEYSEHVSLFETCWTPTVVNVLTVDGVSKGTFLASDSVSLWSLKSLDSIQ